MPHRTLLTVAPTGAEAAKADVPALPVTLDELASTAKACAAAGAAVVHLHVRDANAAPTLDQGLVSAAVSAVREATDCVVQVSTGGAIGDTQPARLAVLNTNPDAATLTCGTVNFGDEVFENPWGLIEQLYLDMREREIVPEFEIFELGHVETMIRLLDRHGEPYGGHVHADFVLGVPGAMPGTLPTLLAVVAALPARATWSATGVGRAAIPVLLGALGAGGHVRVGLEDTLTFAPGRGVRDNTELVERAAELARLAQRPPMTTDEARTMLGIKDRRTTPTQTRAQA